jgi:PAT family beta-lactamase induction signal transducer AmpG
MDDALSLKSSQPDVGGKPAPRSLGVTLRSLGRPKVGLMFLLGFSSGLPFMLIGNTLGYWLAEAGVKLALIGFLSWITLTYSVKFLWGAAVDRLPPPFLHRLGRRRGWMILTQLTVGFGLLGMAGADPRHSLSVLVAFGLLAGIGAAAQDTVIDAWRIESAADADELGLLTAAYSLGFRIALIATESWILLLADRVGWSMSYGLYGALMGVGIAAALLCREPARADAAMSAKSAEAARKPLSAAMDVVVGPFTAFLRAHGVLLAALMLGMITLYHLCDYLRGPMTNPYYKALGIPKSTVGWVRTTIGLAGSMAGVALGGISSVRLGNPRTLVLGALLQPLAVAAFALLAWRGGDWALLSAGPLKVTAFEAIMGFDSMVMAYSGVALVAFMSTLTSLGYTATQYALLTSALTWTGKTLKGFSGIAVESLRHGRTLQEAYGLFYLVSASVGLPAIALCFILALRRPARSPAA